MGKIKEIFGVVDDKEDSEEDDVDKELKDELNDQIREELRRAKLAKIRTYRIKNEYRAKKLLKKLEEEEESYPPAQKKGEPAVSVADVEVAKELSKLPEEEQRKVLTLVTMLKSAPSNPNAQAALILPLLLGLGGFGQVKNTDQAEAFTKSLELAKSIVELTSGGREKVDVAAIMKSVVETAKTLRDMGDRGDNSLMVELAKRTLSQLDSPPRSFIEEVMEDEKKQHLLERLFGSKVDKEVLEIQRQMENDRRKWDLLMRKYDEESKLRHAQILNEIRRNEMIQNGLKSVVAAFSQALAESGSQVVPTQPYTPPSQPIPTTQPPTSPSEPLSVFKCEKCGTDIRYVDLPTTRTVTCPSCGTVYQRTVEESGKEEAKSGKSGSS
jgi:uncharacterized Rmd1/YagE family protein